MNCKGLVFEDEAEAMTFIGRAFRHCDSSHGFYVVPCPKCDSFHVALFPVRLGRNERAMGEPIFFGRNVL